MANSVDPDQLASSEVGFFRSQLIWIYTVCKGRVFPVPAGEGLKYFSWILEEKDFTFHGNHQSFSNLLGVLWPSQRSYSHVEPVS